MLTATYTLVALSVEQTDMRLSLHSVQQLVQQTYAQQSRLTSGQTSSVCAALGHLYDGFQGRKLERFLLPVLRRTGATAVGLLLELDALSRNASEALASASRLRADGVDTPAAVAAFCAAIERFCSMLTQRFEREECELFPLARAAIVSDAWFAVANQMLAHDAYRAEHRGRPPPSASRASRAEPASRGHTLGSFVH